MNLYFFLFFFDLGEVFDIRDYSKIRDGDNANQFLEGSSPKTMS